MHVQTPSTIWLTDESQILTANIGSLHRSILTQDGKGIAFKQKVLQELLDREYTRGYVVAQELYTPVC